ncbi:MAG: hypothetical protein ACYTGL_28755 [Planctomycetota bacterium]|jgi:hypothetical protein
MTGPRLPSVLIAVLLSAAGIIDATTLHQRARAADANSQSARTITYFGYDKAIALRNATTRVVLCPQVGGRVLEYSLNGTNSLYLSDEEKAWKPGDRPEASAGRFDIGPELVIPRRPTLWSGEWTGEITGPRSARLTSQNTR